MAACWLLALLLPRLVRGLYWHIRLAVAVAVSGATPLARVIGVGAEYFLTITPNHLEEARVHMTNMFISEIPVILI